MADAPGPAGDALNVLAFTQNLGGDWILVDGDTDGNEFAASEETMIATLRRMIANLETKFRAERVLDVVEAADELVVLCDALDKAEEDEEDLAADTQELGKEFDAGDEDEDEKDVLHDPKMDRHVTSHS